MLLIAISILTIVLLSIIELAVGKYRNIKTHTSQDSITTLCCGMAFTAKGMIGIPLIMVTYPTLKEHLAVHSYDLEVNLAVIFLSLVALDLGGYWMHRLFHRVNILWDQHLVHHNSEEMNVIITMRQNVSSLFGIYAFFQVPAAILGLPLEALVSAGIISRFMQIWYHTKLIPKLGILEYIIVTPSIHRVHHGINDEYIDKNYGQVFSIWDRLFGTFQEELDDVPVVYGIRRPSHTSNVIQMNYEHFILLCKDAWRTNRLRDKLIIWFMPTGWRPQDVINRYPVKQVENPFTLKKFSIPAPKPAKVFFWLQVTLIFILYILTVANGYDKQTLFIYASAHFAALYGLTALMSKGKTAIYGEGVKMIILTYLLVSTGDLFNSSVLFTGAQYLVMGLLLINFTFFIVIYLLMTTRPQESEASPMVTPH